MSSFRRDFKAFYDVTPQQWVKEKRLEKAANLLDKQDLHVSDVAYEVGYENISYFIQAFKSQYGKSPKQYMLAHQRNQLRP
jgi:AraC-like DNA-binding protein